MNADPDTKSQEVTGGNGDNKGHEHDETCLDVINEAVAGEPGIVNVSLDTGEERVSFDYDPDFISGSEIFHVAQGLAPTLHRRWDTCTMRLGRHGGRACESCALALEDRVQNIKGVRRATASYMGGVLSVTYDDALISPDELVQRVEQLGIPVAPSAAEILHAPDVADRPGTALDRARRWLTAERVEAIFVAITFVAMMLGLVADRMLGLSTLSAASYAVAYVTGGVFGLRAGLESLFNKTIDVDVLMVLAAVGAAVVGAPFEGAMLLFLFSLSNVLQNFALNRTRKSIRSLIELRPEQAMVRRGDGPVVLPIWQVRVGDRVLVRPGERVPLDGVVVEGESSVDQASLTGESIPVTKGVGDTVFAGTINQQGGLEVGVTRLAKDSTIAKLIKMVEEAQSDKAQTQRVIDRVEQYYAMGVIGLTALAIIVPVFVLQEDFESAFYRAMTLLVAASPCAIVISTPATVLSAIANGARNGILFKGGAYVEQAATIKVVAFDKTGTLTEGKPKVTDIVITSPFQMSVAGKTEPTGAVEARGLSSSDVSAGRPAEGESPYPLNATSGDGLLALAAAVEARSEHPLAQAVVNEAKARQLDLPAATSFQAATGLGVRAVVGGREILVGNQRFLAGFATLGLEEATGTIAKMQDEGKTSIVVAQLASDGETGHVLGVIGIADVLRPDAAQVVRELKSLGVEQVVMLTGDNERVAHAIAAEAGVDHYYSELLPEDKMGILKRLNEKYGPVGMVGDGVNDAPALASATIGVAMGAAGTDVALETADVVLMADDLGKIPYVIALSRQTRKTLVQNLVFAFAVILILVAAVFRVDLPLPLSVVGHEGSTVIVSLNGLRLLGYDPGS